jgi:hypothetical protein
MIAAELRGRIINISGKAKRVRDMLADYDFSQGMRSKYAQRYSEGTNLIVLSPDVAEFFPDSDAANAALRALVEIARKSRGRRLLELWGECARPLTAAPPIAAAA